MTVHGTVHSTLRNAYRRADRKAAAQHGNPFLHRKKKQIKNPAAYKAYCEYINRPIGGCRPKTLPPGLRVCTRKKHVSLAKVGG